MFYRNTKIELKRKKYVDDANTRREEFQLIRGVDIHIANKIWNERLNRSFVNQENFIERVEISLELIKNSFVELIFNTSRYDDETNSVYNALSEVIWMKNGDSNLLWIIAEYTQGTNKNCTREHCDKTIVMITDHLVNYQWNPYGDPLRSYIYSEYGDSEHKYYYRPRNQTQDLLFCNDCIT